MLRVRIEEHSRLSIRLRSSRRLSNRKVVGCLMQIVKVNVVFVAEVVAKLWHVLCSIPVIN